MLLGTVIIGSAISIASGGILLIVISAIIGLGVGGILGSFIRKNYKEVYSKLTPLERANFRARVMMEKFDGLRKDYDKETGSVILEKIAYEGKKVLSLSGERKPSIIKE